MRAPLPAGLLLLLTLAASAHARSRPAMAPDNARQCINRHAIRDQSAESDSKLIFHTGGGKAWRNYLPEPCENLRRINNVDKIKLRSADPDQLCVGDTVEVLDHDGSLLGTLGVGDTQTISCRLGQFEPVSEMSLSEEFRR